MTYRNDRDADQARIAALQQELAAAHQRISHLEGRPAEIVEKLLPRDAGALTREVKVKVVESETFSERTRTYDLDRAMTVARAGDLLGCVNDYTPRRGRVTRNGTGATWEDGNVEIALVAQRGRTRIVASQSTSAVVHPRVLMTGSGGFALLAVIVSPLYLLAMVGWIAVMLGINGSKSRDRRHEATVLFDLVADLVARDLR
ncbi:MAG: hypothetical protein ABI867_10395 [Kofleriaceae bacterium]